MMVKQGRYMPGVRVNKVDLARIFGVEYRVIDLWLCKGLPYICKPNPRMREAPDEREWLFDTAEAIEWRVTTPSIEDD